MRASNFDGVKKIGTTFEIALRPFPMCFFFFPVRFWLVSQSWTFYARKATESAVCFSEWVHLLSERYPTQKNPLVDRRSSNYCLPAKIWSKKSELAPNPKIGLFTNEGQLQIIFCRIMHRGQQLELRLCGSGFLSWVTLGDTVDWFREVHRWFPQLIRQKRTWTQKSQNRSGQNLIRIGNGQTPDRSR